MELFSLVYGFDYESETIIGIFDLMEKAENAMIEYDKALHKSSGIDYYTIYRNELNVSNDQISSVNSYQRGTEIYNGVIFENKN